MSSDDEIAPQFHRGLTLFLALALCLFLCRGTFSSVVPGQRILQLETPALTAREHFERSIEIEEATASDPAWARRALQWVLEHQRPALVEAADAYAEVIDQQAGALRDPSASAEAPAAAEGEASSSWFSFKPLELPPRDDRATLIDLLVRLAVVQGEADRPDEAHTAARRLERLGEPGFANAIDYAYGALEPATRRAWSSFDVSRLAPGWARERLELRLAQRTDEAARVIELTRHAEERAARLRPRIQVLAACWLAPSLLGLLALLVWLLKNRPALPQGAAGVPATWPFEDGFAVLTRSLVLGLIVFLLVRVGLHALALPLADVWSMLVAPLPMLWLMQRGLLAPRMESFARSFGLDALPGAAWRWIALVLALFTANQLGAALIADLLGRIGIGTHWTETIDESLLHAKALTFGALAFVMVAWLPIFQELFCRGILFLTLRARMPLTPAALWSAALVAAFSNLSPPGFLAWIWGGFTFALTFEKARSLLPLVACLALANALQCLAYQLLYR